MGNEALSVTGRQNGEVTVLRLPPAAPLSADFQAELEKAAGIVTTSSAGAIPPPALARNYVANQNVVNGNRPARSEKTRPPATLLPSHLLTGHSAYAKALPPS